ncbi:MAG: endolytic transglycosylase MltG [Pseudomonadota bacterium]
MRFVWISVIVLLGIVGAGLVWLRAPMGLPADTVEVSIETGTSPRGVAQAMAEAGVQVQPTLLYSWFRISGQSTQLRAGSYVLDRQDSPWTLTRKLVQGEESLRAITLVEGWNFRQVMAALAKADALKPDTQGLGAEQIMQKLGREGVAAEGRFFPDTYTYARGSSDLGVLRRALQAQDRHLAEAWAQRPANSPLKSPEEVLTLASIVEKETGRASDRPLIAGVFTNRLRLGMMLQTDPSVIYGLGERFDGNLRRKDLQTDTPWNTYTRAGLPPTPIAMPGKASLLAAVKPADTRALYFVARGDGTSQFSVSLEEHNQAVNKYQRKQ